MENHHVYRLLAGRVAGVPRRNFARKDGALRGRRMRHFTALTNYWFKRKTYLYLTSLGLDKGLFVKSIVKKCSVAAVLALAALMPDFRLLNTRPGLALIADLEGRRLTPYQCSAGAWTSGIGHTAASCRRGKSPNGRRRRTSSQMC